MQGHSTFVKIPRERIGVLIGTKGGVRELIEKRLSTDLGIDSQSGDVTITLKEDVNDPSLLFRAKDVVTAIGRGFSPESVFKLIEDEDNILEIVDLREVFGRSESDISRIKGRIIGREGKTRRIIEEMTGTRVSVYGHTVSMIGGIEQVDIAREAIKMLIKGNQHKTVYRFLQRKRHELKLRSLELWQSETPRDLGI
ncbi:MAG: KH domain-containing protein [Candidatus Bathyarchaeota archaeon]|nr:KH domain-containing protein [Candidatus Bathyarchaeota archaeon]